LTIRNKISFWAIVLATSPCLLLAVPIAVFEDLMGSRTGVALMAAKPFLWAVERGDDR
jgi:hypothetical protein